MGYWRPSLTGLEPVKRRFEPLKDRAVERGITGDAGAGKNAFPAAFTRRNYYCAQGIVGYKRSMGNGMHPGQQGIAAPEYSLQVRASGPDDWYQCLLGQNGEFSLTVTAGKYYLELEVLEADQTPRMRIPVREALWIDAGEQCILTLD